MRKRVCIFTLNPYPSIKIKIIGKYALNPLELTSFYAITLTKNFSDGDQYNLNVKNLLFIAVQEWYQLNAITVT